MIDNNLSFDIAPLSLRTGDIRRNRTSLSELDAIPAYQAVSGIMTNEQTLVVESGHPLGLFNHPEAACYYHQFHDGGMFDNQKDWEAMQMGVANYGQMTAGGWMYIGPQGIVHGTFNTLLNAGRMFRIYLRTVT